MNKKRNEEFENIIKNNINDLFLKSKKNKTELAKYLMLHQRQYVNIVKVVLLLILNL